SSQPFLPILQSLVDQGQRLPELFLTAAVGIRHVEIRPMPPTENPPLRVGPLRLDPLLVSPLHHEHQIASSKQPFVELSPAVPVEIAPPLAHKRNGRRMRRLARERIDARGLHRLVGVVRPKHSLGHRATADVPDTDDQNSIEHSLPTRRQPKAHPRGPGERSLYYIRKVRPSQEGDWSSCVAS